MSVFSQSLKHSGRALASTRHLARTKMVVPVRIFTDNGSGEQNIFLAHTLDASTAGARFGGFHGELNVGQNVTVQYQHRRSVFRVVWIGKRGTPQATQIGLLCVDRGKNIWNMDESEGLNNGQVTSRRASATMQQRWSVRIGF